MKKTIRILCKIVFAGIAALLILSLLFSCYFRVPVHRVNPNGNTDFVWEPNSSWVRITEGYSWGNFDENGYNNVEVISDPDIIVVGSSHMEATNVMQDEGTAYVLGELLQGKYTVYNLGISATDFYKVCQYLPQTLAMYDECPRYIIIETSTTAVTGEQLEKILEHSIEPLSSYDSGIVANMQKIPFLRMVWFQIQNGLLDMMFPMPDYEKGEDGEMQTANKVVWDDQTYDDLFAYLGALQAQYDTQFIIFYHPMEQLNSDGSIYFAADESTELFERGCVNQDIIFVNMADKFTEMYYEQNRVPHGFSNGRLGYGHINKYGHQAIAQAIYEVIENVDD